MTNNRLELIPLPALIHSQRHHARPNPNPSHPPHHPHHLHHRQKESSLRPRRRPLQRPGIWQTRHQRRLVPHAQKPVTFSKLRGLPQRKRYLLAPRQLRLFGSQKHRCDCVCSLRCSTWSVLCLPAGCDGHLVELQLFG